MSKRVKGITISIDGDTTGLDKALEGVEKNARKAQGELNDINKLLKLNPNDTELVAQKMAVLGEAVTATETKLSGLRQAQQQVQQQFDRGEIGADQYRAFMREITDTEASLASYKNQISAVQAEQTNLANSTKQMQRFFDATGQSIDDFADVLGTDLVNAIKQGRATSTQLESAFDQIGQSALGANADLDRLRTSLRTMDSGGSLDDVRRDLQQIEQESTEAEKSVEKLSDAFSAMGGIVAGLGIGQVVEQALSESDLQTKIDITFDVPEESKGVIRQTLADVQALGVEGEEGLEGLRRQFALNKDAATELNVEVVKSAAALTKVYSGVDFVELIQETNEISAALEITDQEALDLVDSLLNIGFPAEQLDIISEYGTQLNRAGFSAKEVQGILAAAVATDSWNIDILLDGLKEGRILAAEMGMGLSTGMRDSIKIAVGNVSTVTEEQLSTMSDAFSEQESALSKSLSRQSDVISKSHDKQKQSFDKQMQQQYDAASKVYDKQVEALEKSLSKEYDAVSKSYDKQQRELEKSLSKELQEFEKATNEKIKLIDKEYLEKMKLIDEERYNQLKAIDEQIDALNAQTDAEDKALKNRENAEKRAELQRKARQAKTSKDRIAAQKDLRDFDEKLRLDALKEQRKGQIDTLKDQKDVIKESSDAQKDALKTEVDEKKSKLKEESDLEKEALKERQDEQKRLFQEQKQVELSAIQESNKAQIKALQDVNKAKLDYLKEEQDSRKEALSERLSSELEATREAHQSELESFKKMNAEKLELAKNPPDSAAFKKIEEDLMNWGKAIAKGDEEGSKAFKEMTAWLDSIEDATLRNSIGIGLFGTKWEESGEDIISTIKNMDTAYAEMSENERKAAETAAEARESGLVSYKKAIGDLQIAIAPLLEVIAKVIGALSGWVSKNPEIAAVFATLATVIGILVGAFAFLAPAIAAIPGVIATLAPAFATITGLFTTLTTVILPALGVAFGSISAPLVIAIGVIVGLVILLIKKWEPIKKFFKDLWAGIEKIFKSASTALSGAATRMGEAIMRPIHRMRDAIVNAFEFVKKKLSDIWQGIVEIIKKPLNMLIELLNKFINGVNNIKVPDWVPIAGGKGINIPEIPMLAKGTDYFRGGPAIVGEFSPTLNRTKSVKSKLKKWVEKLKYGIVNQWDRLGLITLIDKERQTLLPV